MLVLMVLFSSPLSAKPSNSCQEWFRRSEADSADCLLKCLSFKIDFATASCKNQCESLCKSLASKNAEPNIYGLTDAELTLSKKEPVMMSKAYLKSWEAETACGRLYKVSDTNDESDACRHFVWAATLTEAFGREHAEEILNAHEQNPLQPEEEKSMDLANNRRGVSIAEKMLRKNDFQWKTPSASLKGT